MRPAWCGFHAGGTYRNPIVCGRKFCAQCGRWRIISDFTREANRHKDTLRSWCVTCTNRKKAETREKIKLDPIRLEHHREYQRIWAEVQRRRAGIPPKCFSNKITVIDRIEHLYLPPDPLVKEIVRFNNYRELSKKSGVPERSIRRLVDGESRRVRLDLADKIAHALDIPLELLYRDQEFVRR
jgi:hypothetical protein